ncbi:unnamed protein product [Ostreobium quekettii]|uniref:glucan endo-1,3-beta-D-glucosidase n=1 Tax=Ostreobium quekettii TaxID=121088 RepID=A0A8S1ILV1_9CHLO|nr:unnamed protein product [Ostreobium quekettii]|eukprot:evm.model.scf_57.21 EVM.evm.TU.scf_57.21   scf_57:176863-179160(+)
MAVPNGVAAGLVLVVLLAWMESSGGATVVGSKTIVNVGGVGSYDEVYGMPCSGQAACLKRPRAVGGCLAPFDEEQTLKLRGPMEVYNIGVYYPGAGGVWDRVSFYDRSGGMDNMVFLADYGRALDGTTVDEGSCWSGSGDWKLIINGDDFLCNGYNQSYVSRDGKCARRTPEAFDGILDDGVQVNVMQAAKCGGDECGFYRGQGHHGWAGPAGGAKLFAVRARFPEGEGANAPALWFLHASVVRTANYHPQVCNCRGMGAAGGCGELDIAEVVEEQDRKQDVDTTVYSFKGAFSDQGAYTFQRPVQREAVFVTIFNPEGYIQVLQMDGFDFGASIPASMVQNWNGRRELVIKLPGEEMGGCAAPRCSYIYESGNAGFASRIKDGVQCSGGVSDVPDASTLEKSAPSGMPASPQELHPNTDKQSYPRPNADSLGQQQPGHVYSRPSPGSHGSWRPSPEDQDAPESGTSYQGIPQPSTESQGSPQPTEDNQGNGQSSTDYQAYHGPSTGSRGYSRPSTGHHGYSQPRNDRQGYYQQYGSSPPTGSTGEADSYSQEGPSTENTGSQGPAVSAESYSDPSSPYPWSQPPEESIYPVGVRPHGEQVAQGGTPEDQYYLGDPDRQGWGAVVTTGSSDPYAEVSYKTSEQYFSWGGRRRLTLSGGAQGGSFSSGSRNNPHRDAFKGEQSS